MVTVALGSTRATVLLSKEVALAEGVLALGLLIGLQFLVTWTSVRLPWFSQLVKSEPVMLFHRGRFLPTAMRRARVIEAEGARSPSFTGPTGPPKPSPRSRSPSVGRTRAPSTRERRGA